MNRTSNARKKNSAAISHPDGSGSHIRIESNSAASELVTATNAQDQVTWERAMVIIIILCKCFTVLRILRTHNIKLHWKSQFPSLT
jgi:hypothetical protein